MSSDDLPSGCSVDASFRQFWSGETGRCDQLMRIWRPGAATHFSVVMTSRFFAAPRGRTHV